MSEPLLAERSWANEVMSARSGFSLGTAGYALAEREITGSDGKMLIKIFSEADEGGKGYLLRHEVKVAMVELLGYKPTKYEVSQMLDEHGRHKGTAENGCSLDRFITCMKEKLSKVDEDEEIRHTFMAFDMQCRGFLTLEDLRKVFAQVAPHVNEQTIQSAFREIDQDCDGRVSYKDFEFLMKYNTEDQI